MKRIFIPIFLVFILLPVLVSAETYYVDARGGDDLNDGLYQTYSPPNHGPWQNISKVNGWSFNPGDSILFKRGEIWREQLIVPSSGNSTDPITFGVYGSGPKPILSGGDMVTGWEQSDTNIWKATLTSTPEMTFFDESGTITWGDQKGSVGALVNEYDWYYDSVGDLLYCYAATDPDSRYTSVEASLRSSCIDWGSGVDRSYITIENLELKFAKRDGVLIRSYTGASTGNIVQDCTVHHIGDNGGSKLGDGIEFQGCSGNQAINNTAYECGRHGIWVIAYGSPADDNIIESNTLYDHWYGAIDVLVDDGDPASLDGTIVRYNYIYNAGSGDFPAIHAKGNSGISVTNLYIYDNVAYNIADHGIKIHPDVASVYIYNNCISTTTISNTAAILLDNGAGTSVVKNNIGYKPKAYAMDVKDSTNKIIDYNCWYLSGGFNSYVDGASRNWIYWTGTAGFDANGLNSNPLFTNASGGDFHLTSNSPVIDNGTYVGLTQDFEGNPVPQGSAPDMGAYEYGSLSTCTGICKSNPCDSYDDCTNASGTCPPSEFCCSGTCIFCGDDDCDFPIENCSSCPQDCGCVFPQICCDGVCSLPECSENSHCGSDPCKNYTCNNPGTCSASCSSQEKTECTGGDDCCPAWCNEGNDNDCVVLEGPVAWYHFDEGLGITTADSSGNGNDGTVYGATWTTGVKGNTLNFDGVDDYVDCGSDSSLDIANAEITIVAWINRKGITASGYQQIVYRGIDSAHIYRFLIENDNHLAGGLNWGGTNNRVESTATIDANKYYQVGGVFSVSSTKLYIDGSEVSTGASVGWGSSGTGSLKIGMRNNDSYFNGTIDEVRIYNRTLSEEEILELYNEGMGNYSKADLNNDGSVDIFDLDIIATHFGQTQSHQDWNATADIFQNNEIDVFDVVFVASRFG